MIYNSELEFEKDLISVLSTKGWEKEVIKNPTEEDLIKNWANILFNNNRDKDKEAPYCAGKLETEVCHCHTGTKWQILCIRSV